MRGLGTIINVGAIIAGGFFGAIFGSKLNEKAQASLTIVCGVSTIFMSIASAMTNMLTINNDLSISSGKSMLCIICLALGTLIGEVLDIDGKVEHFGEWLKVKTGNQKEARFVEGFVVCSLTVCVGAMAIVGSIEDGINGDYSILATKSILDFIIVLVMSGSLGKGCAFSAIPVAIIQGLVTVLAIGLQSILTPLALANISLVGSLMIFCVGLNLVFKQGIRVANMLPGLLFAIMWAYIF